MARIRTIKPDFFRHGGLFDAEQETGLPLRLAFAGLWTACDREGRFAWKPRELKLDALPFDEVDFSRVLDALWTRGHIIKYAVNGVIYGCIPSWHDHQVVNNREAASVLPEPDESSMLTPPCTRAQRVADPCPTPLVQDQGEGKGREGKGREGEASAPRVAAAPPPARLPKPKPKDEAPELTLADIVAEGVPEQCARDWLKVRAKHRAPVTATAWEGFRREAGKAGLTLGQAVKLAAEKSWRGFDASWVKPGDRPGGGGMPSTADRDAEAKRLLFGKGKDKDRDADGEVVDG